MYYPTTRVLTVLELLQSQPTVTGAQIAQHLEVDLRTARRYIAMLEDLGIPVTADRGRYGGYRLMPGYKLPPLMLNEEEALALTMGLLAAKNMGLATHAPAVDAVLVKIERVLPERLRERLRLVREALVWDISEQPAAGPSSPFMLKLSAAATGRRQVALRYVRSDGHETSRTFDTYGIVCQRGSWYATGYCHLREDIRLFRLDRVVAAELLETGFVKPVGFDPLESVVSSLGSVPRELKVEVLLETTLENARRHIAVRVAVLEEVDDTHVLLRGYTDNADWLARLLARVGYPLVVQSPPQLRDALLRHSQQIASWASQGD